jgi:CheY-like chemotaxis protein
MPHPIVSGAMSSSEQRWINLEKASVLVLEQSAYSFKILSQILRGFGIREIFGPKTVINAINVVENTVLNLIIADPGFDEGRGLEFLRWLRRAPGNDNRWAPIILLLGHTTPAAVKMARDAGANVILAKPYPPRTLLDRILWVSRDKRPYVEVGAYVGPDRRFKTEGPPDSTQGRREEDAQACTQADDSGGEVRQRAEAS